MKLLLSGSSGIIGSRLIPNLARSGHDIVKLVRREIMPGSREISWDPPAGKLDPLLVEGFDAIIHLAGENVSSARWTAAKKRRILASRIVPTRLLAETIAKLRHPPAVWLCASATGFYGSRGNEILSEQSMPGGDFLADVCKQWEAATLPAAGKTGRIVLLRIGAVLDLSGGALALMLPAFRRGLGGYAGDGMQYLPWISLRDTVRAIEHVLADDAMRGPVNLVAPEQVTNRQFARALADALHRRANIPIPAWILRALYGEMARQTILSSARVEPAKLIQHGFEFLDPTLKAALSHILS